MKRPLAFLLLVIVLAWLLRFEQVSISGAVPAIEPDCGNAICEPEEDANNCDEDCDPVCGNNAAEEDEDCDGIDDALCPELCLDSCKCPPPELRDFAVLPYRYIFSYENIASNEVLAINLDKLGVAFQSISVVSSQELKDASFIIDSNVSAPPQLPNGTTYAYFKVQMRNLSQEQYLVHIDLFFRVPTEWTIEHNVKQIELERAGITWQSVETEKLYQNMDYVYFSAKPDKLGLFAIVSPLPPPKPQPVCGNNIIETDETSETCCADAGCPANQSCISNTCKFVVICGNNICEPSETAKSCSADCAAVKFKPSTAPALVLMVAALVAILFVLYRKLPALYEKPKVGQHATPERWF